MKRSELPSWAATSRSTTRRPGARSFRPLSSGSWASSRTRRWPAGWGSRAPETRSRSWDRLSPRWRPRSSASSGVSLRAGPYPTRTVLVSVTRRRRSGWGCVLRRYTMPTMSPKEAWRWPWPSAAWPEISGLGYSCPMGSSRSASRLGADSSSRARPKRCTGGQSRDRPPRARSSARYAGTRSRSPAG